MAAIAFDTAHQAEHIPGRLKAVLAILREMLDAFVSYRIRLATAKDEHVRPRHPLGMSSPSIKTQ